MTKLLAAMFSAPFALVLNTAIAQNAKWNQDKAQAQTEMVERKIGRGERTDWAGRRVPTEPENARSAPTGGNAKLVMTCQGKTGHDKDKCLGHAEGGKDDENAGASAKEKEGGEQYKRKTQ